MFGTSMKKKEDMNENMESTQFSLVFVSKMNLFFKKNEKKLFISKKKKTNLMVVEVIRYAKESKMKNGTPQESHSILLKNLRADIGMWTRCFVLNEKMFNQSRKQNRKMTMQTVPSIRITDES